MNRRNFFKLVAGAGLIAVAPRLALSAPLLVGDGIADDTRALQALIDGLPVEFGPAVDMTGAGWVGNKLTMPSGRFMINAPLVFKDMESVHISGGGSLLLVGPEADCAISVSDCRECTISGCTIASWEVSAGIGGYLVEDEGIYQAEGWYE